MDFAEDRLINERRFMALLVKDEATAFGLALRVAPSFKAVDLENVLDELVAKHGSPAFIRSDNGGQFISFTIQRWAQRRNITLAYIQPGKPWQNGLAECFVGTYRTEVLNAEVFHSISESDVVSRSLLRCTTTSVHTVSTTIFHQRLLSQHVQHDHYFLDIELV